MMKKLVRSLCLALAALCLCALPALADTQGDFSYTYDASLGGAVLTGYTGTAAHITVPDTLGGYPVVSLPAGVFSGRSAASIRLPDSLRYLDCRALHECAGLTAAYLPDNITELTFPDILGNFATYVHKDSATAHLMINRAEDYPSACFIDPDLPTMKLYYVANADTGALELGLYRYIGSKETVRILDGIMHIYDQAFMDTDTYTNNTTTKFIYMPDSVVSVGAQAFQNLPNLTEVHLSPNIATWRLPDVWGAAPTFDMRNRPKLYCASNSTTMRTITSEVTTLGIIDPAEPDLSWGKDANGGLVLMGYYGDASSFTVPDGVTGIGESAFSDLPNLETIIVPESVTSIGLGAFGIDWNNYLQNPDAYRPQRIYLPDGITSCSLCIADTTRSTLYFTRNSLTDLNIGTAGDGRPMRFIDPADPDWMWQGNCSGIILGYFGDDTTVALPEGATKIGEHGLFDISQYTTFILPDNIGFDSDPYNPNMAKIICSSDSATAANIDRLNDETGRAYYCYADPDQPDHLIAQYKGKTYYMGYTGYSQTLEIPEGFDVINDQINMKSPHNGVVTRIIVPEGVTTLKSSAFWGWPSVRDIILPSTLTTIGQYAFSNLHLPVLVIPEGVTALPAKMTEYSYVEYAVIPDSVTSISSTAFTTTGDNKLQKVYCSKGSYAAKWATGKKIPVSYLEDCEYTIYLPEIASYDIGETIDWNTAARILPQEPDIPYTLKVASSNSNIASVSGQTVTFKKTGKVRLTVKSTELDASTQTPYINVYKPITDFTLPEYFFAKYGSTGALQISSVTPTSQTNPVYTWHRYPTDTQGAHTAVVPEYDLVHVPAAGTYTLDVTSYSGITRRCTLVSYNAISDVRFAAETPLYIGMSVAPQVSMYVDGVLYENNPALYTLSSSDPAVVSVQEDGSLQAVAPGTATITMTANNGTRKTQTVTVKNERLYRLPQGMKRIEAEAFASCPANVIVIAEGCTSIGSRAFADCAQLKEITIPQSVTSIAADAFSGCAQLTIRAAAGSYAQRFAQEHNIPLAAD